MPKVYTYRIHPAIGIARLGNSPESFDGPTVYDRDFRPPESPAGSGLRYRDLFKRIRRQAARFGIYEYEYPNTTVAKQPNGKPSNVREVTLADVRSITWAVHLANHKSFTSGGKAAPIDPGELSLGGRSQPAIMAQGTAFAGTPRAESVVLGEFLTDADGRLRAIGGFGLAKFCGPSSMPATIALLRNPYWCDDVADGPVRATIELNDGRKPAVVSAWLVTGVPDFAHATESVVNLFDLALDIAVREFHYPTPQRPSFTEDIFPTLDAAAMMRWVSNVAHLLAPLGQHNFVEPARLALLQNAHSVAGTPERRAREALFARLRKPRGASTSQMRMPLLGPALGQPPLSVAPFDHIQDPVSNRQLTLTEHRHKAFAQWMVGQFKEDWPGARPTAPSFASLSAAAQAKALDRAHMCAMVGGSFFPGIEVGKRVLQRSSWGEPFRIKESLPAGTLTETLSVPWQADFTACSPDPDNPGGWWPSHRMDVVLPTKSADQLPSSFRSWTAFSAAEMTALWHELGFLAPEQVGSGDAYVETERIAAYPP